VLTSSLDNAYVSGLKEDLGLHGNELVQLQTIYTIGAVVGQLPFAYLFTKLPMHWIIPFMDIAWGIFTLVQYRATSYAEMAAYRFLVGWFEVSHNLYSVRIDPNLIQAAYYPGMHYIFGIY
jgi:predicted MFS family arabinose efflux permease